MKRNENIYGKQVVGFSHDNEVMCLDCNRKLRLEGKWEPISIGHGTYATLCTFCGTSIKLKFQQMKKAFEQTYANEIITYRVMRGY